MPWLDTSGSTSTLVTSCGTGARKAGLPDVLPAPPGTPHIGTQAALLHTLEIAHPGCQHSKFAERVTGASLQTPRAPASTTPSGPSGSRPWLLAHVLQVPCTCPAGGSPGWSGAVLTRRTINRQVADSQPLPSQHSLPVRAATHPGLGASLRPCKPGLRRIGQLRRPRLN